MLNWSRRAGGPEGVTDQARAWSYAEAHRCDLIAMATRGRGGVQRLFLGSVADKVIRGAATPVLVVNPTAGAFSQVLGQRPATASRPAGADVGVLQGAVNATATL